MIELSNISNIKTPSPILPRVGIDRLLFSGPRRYGPPVQVPGAFGPWVRVADHISTHPSYRRRASYRDPDGMAVDVYYHRRPKAIFCPVLQLQFRGTWYRLLGVKGMKAAIQRFEDQMKIPLVTLSLMELAFDAPGDPQIEREFYEHLYIPWARTRRGRYHDQGKTEDGVHFPRAELRLHREALRGMGLNRLADLPKVDWFAFLARRVRWVKRHGRQWVEHRMTPFMLEAIWRFHQEIRP